MKEERRKKKLRCLFVCRFVVSCFSFFQLTNIIWGLVEPLKLLDELWIAGKVLELLPDLDRDLAWVLAEVVIERGKTTLTLLGNRPRHHVITKALTWHRV